MKRRPREVPRPDAGATAPGGNAFSRAHGEADSLPVLELTNRIWPADRQDGKAVQACDGGVPYLDHFGLKAAPFSLLPDPAFLYWSANHKRAHAMLEYGLMNRAPLTLITGEIGAGKTTLLHKLLSVPGAAWRVGLISNASELRGELLYWVLMALGERPPATRDAAALFEAFQRCLIETYATARRVVIIFDEAQTLGRERLEALRMLTNINTGTDVLLQIVLVGQPELRDTIRQPDMVQFAQRVAASFHLSAMDEATQARYIAHRLSIAGVDRAVFDEEALALIHETTGGVPRLTNQVCDFAMLYAYSADKTVVDRASVRHVIDEGLILGTGPVASG
jgi:type II secretory pathway predicted ATPase ExeA